MKYLSHYVSPTFWPRLLRRQSNTLKVIVTGLPRSGTSFLAGLIHCMGFSIGPKKWLRDADEHNPYGYYECVPLLHISERILSKFGGDFTNVPVLSPGWTNSLGVEKKDIIKIVQIGELEMYKGNRLVVLADLYDELFPNAKWIFITRDVNETYKSRFGEDITIEQWQRITSRRLAAWNTSQPASKALYVDYQSFKTELKQTILEIQAFLDVDLTADQFQACVDFYMPRDASSAVLR